ncbi:MAG: hypothetical protein NT103_02675 [Campylobacterales bacterium]|nr:hypothetical protein [Campylobacterales bacterium]
MKKSLFSALLAAGLLIGFSGCAGVGAGVPETKQLQHSEPKVVTFNFPSQDSVTGENLAVDLSSYNLSNEIVKLSTYPAFHITRQASDGIHITDYSGLKVEKKQGSYLLRYANGDLNNNSWYLTESDFDINYAQNDTNRLTFIFPKDYKFQPFRNAIGIAIDPLASQSNLEADAKSVFDKLDQLTLTINKNYAFKGEVNTKYPDKAVYANFKRLMGIYNWRVEDKVSDIKKENTFTLTVQGKQYPLYVEVFPYRDGTKVIYSTTVGYVINSKGSCSLNQTDIKELNKQIEKIIND